MAYTLNTKLTWARIMSDLDDTMEKWRVVEWPTYPQREPKRRDYDQSVTLTYTRRRRQEPIVLNLVCGMRHGDTRVAMPRPPRRRRTSPRDRAHGPTAPA